MAVFRFYCGQAATQYKKFTPLLFPPKCSTSESLPAQAFGLPRVPATILVIPSCTQSQKKLQAYNPSANDVWFTPVSKPIIVHGVWFTAVSKPIILCKSSEPPFTPARAVCWLMLRGSLLLSVSLPLLFRNALVVF